MTNPIDREALVILEDLRLNARMPTYSQMANKSNCSKTTVFTLFNGNMIQWPSLKRIAESLGADNNTVADLQKIWIRSKLEQKSRNYAPLWVMALESKITAIDNKVTSILELLDKS